MLKTFNQNTIEDIKLRLRTLSLIRWIAICGQLTAVAISYYYFRIQFNILLVIPLIFLSIILNIYVTARNPLIKILSFNETFSYLIFDLVQLILLLSLTGGLTNPFCVLILAPIIISATYLDLSRTIVIGIISIISLTLLAFFYYPLESLPLGINKDDFSNFEIFSIWSALVIALIFIGAYCFRVADESRKTSQALKQTQFALSNEEKISALMGLTAAAVHELGTPLSTISIAAKELVNNASKKDSNYEDLILIQSQLKRCSDILDRLRTNNFSDQSNEFINRLDFHRLVNELLNSYSDREVEFIVNIEEYFKKNHITVSRSPEIIQSLTNIIDNAVKFSKKNVTINLKHNQDSIIVEVIDDGDGFPQDIFPLLGEPYVRNTAKNKHKGLGLGLFISKNLLAKNFGDIKFLNLKNQGGCVQVFLSKDSLGV